MALTDISQLLKDAKKRKYALGYFESWDLASLKAVINAAEEENSPVVVGFNGGILTVPDRILKPEDFEYYGAMGRLAAEKATVPVSLILNEIDNLEHVQEGIKCGFNTVMFECESDDLDEIIPMTSKAVEMAHAKGVCIESNLGQLPIADSTAPHGQSNGSLTTPQGAKLFIEKTNVDVLGVSIGNVEVLTDGKATMNFDLLKQISDTIDVPITLHGGSGIADDDIEHLIACGLCKMNLGAVLNQAFLDALRKTLNIKHNMSPKYTIGSGLKEDILAAGEIAMKEVVQKKMRVYGSTGKA